MKRRRLLFEEEKALSRLGNQPHRQTLLFTFHHQRLRGGSTSSFFVSKGFLVPDLYCSPKTRQGNQVEQEAERAVNKEA